MKKFKIFFQSLIKTSSNKRPGGANDTTSASVKQDGETAKPGMYPADSVQVKLFGYVKDHNREMLKRFLGVLKKRSQNELANSLLAYCQTREPEYYIPLDPAVAILYKAVIAGKYLD